MDKDEWELERQEDRVYERIRDEVRNGIYFDDFDNKMERDMRRQLVEEYARHDPEDYDPEYYDHDDYDPEEYDPEDDKVLVEYFTKLCEVAMNKNPFYDKDNPLIEAIDYLEHACSEGHFDGDARKNLHKLLSDSNTSDKDKEGALLYTACQRLCGNLSYVGAIAQEAYSDSESGSGMGNKIHPASMTDIGKELIKSVSDANVKAKALNMFMSERDNKRECTEDPNMVIALELVKQGANVDVRYAYKLSEVAFEYKDKEALRKLAFVKDNDKTPLDIFKQKTKRRDLTPREASFNNMLIAARTEALHRKVVENRLAKEDELNKGKEKGEEREYLPKMSKGEKFQAMREAKKQLRK